MEDDQEISDDEVQPMRVSQLPRLATASFGVLTSCCLSLIYLPWIIMNLFFADGDSPCLTQDLQKTFISIDLQTWLRVQAYVMIGVAVFPLVGAILGAFVAKMEALFLFVFCCVGVLEPLFEFCWSIVGAVMFWGELYESGKCNTGLTIYMFIRLILGLAGPLCSKFKQEQSSTSGNDFTTEPEPAKRNSIQVQSTSQRLAEASSKRLSNVILPQEFVEGEEAPMMGQGQSYGSTETA